MSGTPTLGTFVEFPAKVYCMQLDYPKEPAQWTAFRCKLQPLSQAGLEPKSWAKFLRGVCFFSNCTGLNLTGCLGKPFITTSLLMLLFRNTVELNHWKTILSAIRSKEHSTAYYIPILLFIPWDHHSSPMPVDRSSCLHFLFPQSFLFLL